MGVKPQAETVNQYVSVVSKHFLSRRRVRDAFGNPFRNIAYHTPCVFGNVNDDFAADKEFIDTARCAAFRQWAGCRRAAVLR